MLSLLPKFILNIQLEKYIRNSNDYVYIEKLLKAGANPNLTIHVMCKKGWGNLDYPLIYDAIDDKKKVELLVKYNANINILIHNCNCKCYYYTSILFFTNNLEIWEILLKNNIDFSKMNYDAMKIINLSNNQIKLLLQYGKTPASLKEFKFNFDDEIIQLFLEYKCTWEDLPSHYDYSLDQIKSIVEKYNIDKNDVMNLTDNLEHFKYLIEKGVDLNNFQNKFMKYLKFSDYESAKFFIENGFDIIKNNIELYTWYESDGWKHLYHSKILELLLENGVNINDNYILFLCNTIETVEILLKYNANPNAKYDNKTVLDVLTKKIGFDVAKILIDAGAKYENVYDNDLYNRLYNTYKQIEFNKQYYAPDMPGAKQSEEHFQRLI